MKERTDPRELTNDEILRYSRHLMLPEVGIEGQRRLKAARVLIVGAGGLGSPVALYLAAAGIGRLGLVDPDVVSYSNLQRQVIHGGSTLGRPKVESAQARLHDLNAAIDIATYREAFTAQTAERIARGYDLIVDGTDNFPTRYLANDVCLRLGIPFAYGAIFRMEGQVSLFGIDGGPCYRCVFPTPPPPESVQTCEEAGVLGVVPGTIGTLQATEVIKWILELGSPLAGRLLIYDAGEMRFETVDIEKNPACPTCSLDRHEIPLIDYEGFCGVADDSLHETVLPEEAQITPLELKAQLAAGRSLRILDVRRPVEWEIVHFDEATLIPLDQLTARIGELDPEEEIVVVCRRGRRSARAVVQLQQAGFRHVRNLVGGLTGWAKEVDAGFPVY